ncbi:hypothetical protein F2P81_022327 [Scophthalmus maximus]|uniref:Uncharacterized protein n=1 Tax=Scophthalmus maximus TaxID=52904 RepID=A0A6A4RS16_SCOMX|nr:hypothetical protein F2P81_022327 [Scophthalmus maximus]
MESLRPVDELFSAESCNAGGYGAELLEPDNCAHLASPGVVVSRWIRCWNAEQAGLRVAEMKNGFEHSGGGQLRALRIYCRCHGPD